ncbi:MAG TPA: hypothetical protein VEK57_17875 [Thermoanaerobaculia bacterium]|nr:hypothetical protein [Thermoanaerobaculia bacterium]
MPKTENPGDLTKLLMTQALSGFVVDLGRRTQAGVSRAERDVTKQWLEDMVAAASVLPDAGLFGKKIYERWRALADAYDQWGSGAATETDRRTSRDRVYKKVNDLTSAVARRTELMRQQADIRMYAAFYVATEKAITAIPNMLQSVAEALSGFKKP